MTTSRDSLELARRCAAVLEDKKAGDLRILDVSEQSSITDCLVMGTATSEPHMRALRIELEKVLDATGEHIVGIESERESGWVVVDLFDVMVHLFLPDVRKHYRLESLWKDAVEVPISAEERKIAKPVKKPRKKPQAKRKATRKAAKKPRSAGKRKSKKS